MEKKLYLMILAILLMVFLIPQSFGKAETKGTGQSILQNLDRLSQEVLELTERGSMTEAKDKLEQLAELFTKIGVEKNMSIEALEMASDTIVQGKRAYTDVTPDRKEMLWHATQIRLLIDALTHPNQPIWKGYHMTYVEQVSKLIHLAGRKEQSDLSKALQDNLKLYVILKPAFAVNHSAPTLEMLDSLYNFLLQQSHENKVQWDAVQQTTQLLQEVTGNIFLGKDQNTFSWYISSNSPVVMISLVSLILLTVLTYSAWKMYRGEQVQGK